MRQIFVNLKRFEVPKSQGGLSLVEDPVQWIEDVINATVELGLGQHQNLSLTYLLPEGLISSAVHRLQAFPVEQTCMLAIGSQGVHWENIQPGKNFGAFTTSLPAAAAAAMGSQWAIIGHSEERKAKLQVMRAYEPRIDTDPVLRIISIHAVDRLVQAEVSAALDSGLKVLLCIGETAEERGEGTFDQQQQNIIEVLRNQLMGDLQASTKALQDGRIVIAYEPVWAIGPGKTPPGREYISFVSATIKSLIWENFGADIAVVYGGGLKEENAALIAGIPTIDGGLVALTRFSGEIGFYVPELNSIIEKYLAV